MDNLNNNDKPLLILTGPTAVGKTNLSIMLAKKLNGEIISADSIQVYKGMDIGSAKITPVEMQGVPHHLIDILNPDEEFNIFIFKELALKAMNEIYSRGRLPIITGGTGFYIQSVLYDIEFNKEPDNQNKNFYRLELENIALTKGNEYLHNILKEIDEEAANSIHFNNVKRVIRAIEYYNETGEKISVHNKNQKNNISPYKFLYAVLNRERGEIYNRINQRVDEMFNNGLVHEINTLLSKGYNSNLVSMQGLGYKEVVKYINDELSLEDTKELIKRDTRHFAKRQLTWFKGEKDAVFYNYEDYNNDVLGICEKITNDFGGIK